MSKEEERLRIVEEVERKLSAGRELYSRGRFEESLECYLWAFDNGKYRPSWLGVRLSYIPEEIARMGKQYPPALKALRERRDVREKLILEGETDFTLFLEWSSLNRYLGESERVRRIIQRLEAENRLPDYVRLLDIGVDKSRLEKRGFPEIPAGEINKWGQRLFSWLHQYEHAVLFPDADDDPQRGDILVSIFRQKVIETGGYVSELLLLAGRDEHADEIEKRLLAEIQDADLFEALLSAALRVGDRDRVSRLWAIAHATLPEDEITRMEKKAFGQQ